MLCTFGQSRFMSGIHSYPCINRKNTYAFRTIFYMLWMCTAYIKAFYFYLLTPGPLCAHLHNAGLWGAYIAIPTCTCQSDMHSEQYSTFCGCAQCKYHMFHPYILPPGPLCAHFHKAGLWGEYIAIPTWNGQQAMYSEQYSTFCGCALHIWRHSTCVYCLLARFMHFCTTRDYEVHTYPSLHTHASQLCIQNNIPHSVDVRSANTLGSTSIYCLMAYFVHIYIRGDMRGIQYYHFIHRTTSYSYRKISCILWMHTS
jgi:hypothetical protein